MPDRRLAHPVLRAEHSARDHTARGTDCRHICPGKLRLPVPFSLHPSVPRVTIARVVLRRPLSQVSRVAARRVIASVQSITTDVRASRKDERHAMRADMLLRVLPADPRERDRELPVAVLIRTRSPGPTLVGTSPPYVRPKAFRLREGMLDPAHVMMKSGIAPRPIPSRFTLRFTRTSSMSKPS